MGGFSMKVFKVKETDQKDEICITTYIDDSVEQEFTIHKSDYKYYYSVLTQLGYKLDDSDDLKKAVATINKFFDNNVEKLAASYNSELEILNAIHACSVDRLNKSYKERFNMIENLREQYLKAFRQQE